MRLQMNGDAKHKSIIFILFNNKLMKGKLDRFCLTNFGRLEMSIYILLFKNYSIENKMKCNLNSNAIQKKCKFSAQEKQARWNYKCEGCLNNEVGKI